MPSAAALPLRFLFFGSSAMFLAATAEPGCAPTVCTQPSLCKPSAESFFPLPSFPFSARPWGFRQNCSAGGTVGAFCAAAGLGNRASPIAGATAPCFTARSRSVPATLSEVP